MPEKQDPKHAELHLLCPTALCQPGACSRPGLCVQCSVQGPAQASCVACQAEDGLHHCMCIIVIAGAIAQPVLQI